MKKKIKKAIKRTNKSILICTISFLILGIIIGYLTTTLITKNDIFAINGEKYITLELNSTYQEEGVNVISFGKNLNNKVKIESDLDTSKEGEYIIIYTVDSFKYKNIKRVRYITVVNGSESNE